MKIVHIPVYLNCTTNCIAYFRYNSRITNDATEELKCNIWTILLHTTLIFLANFEAIF